jgi:hypothetical protein
MYGAADGRRNRRQVMVGLEEVGCRPKTDDYASCHSCTLQRTYSDAKQGSFARGTPKG